MRTWRLSLSRDRASRVADAPVSLLASKACVRSSSRRAPVVQSIRRAAEAQRWPVRPPTRPASMEADMTKSERMIAPLGFGLAAVFFFIAAIKPAFQGGSLNAAFLAVGVIFLVLGIGTWRRTSRGPDEPPG
jgi:hypothetical protein